MRISALILGGILVIYPSAGIVSETWFPDDERIERISCRFLLCANSVVVQSARRQLWSQEKDGPQRAIDTFRLALQRDPHDPSRWADLGEAFLEAGRKEEARYCYTQVRATAPHRPTFLLRVASFYFQVGEARNALAITAGILKSVSGYDSVIFSEYTRLVDDIGDVLRYGMPEDRRASQAFLRYLLQAGRLDDAQRTWEWTAAHGFADDALAGEYAQFLIQRQLPEAAAAAWMRHLGTRSGDYLRTEYLFNGDFESPATATPFDWSVLPVEGVEVARDSALPYSGQWSLRISFPGIANLAYAGVSQMAVLKPGACRFQACVRTDSITTDQGIRFRIVDTEAPARLDLTTGQFTGTTAWTRIEQRFVVPLGTRIVQVQVVRQPSMNFDNKLGGTAWIDGVKLTRMVP
ncbi:MAG: hypothetical protein LAQ30_20780 [Acidobacteriia bacterium]|nr:hypothetical protein [Terriglobia bacterium]